MFEEQLIQSEVNAFSRFGYRVAIIILSVTVLALYVLLSTECDYSNHLENLLNQRDSINAINHNNHVQDSIAISNSIYHYNLKR